MYLAGAHDPLGFPSPPAPPVGERAASVGFGIGCRSGALALCCCAAEEAPEGAASARDAACTSSHEGPSWRPVDGVHCPFCPL
eukprot:3338663-Rhodomonas_salina.3